MDEERLTSRTEFERVRKETFVESMLHQVADGLSSDSRFGHNSANRIRRRVEDIAEDLEDGTNYTTAGRAVLESRFALGHDDSQYLSQAVSLLWAGDGGERLRIVPPALMPEVMRQASAEGIVKAMTSVMTKKQSEFVGSVRNGLEMAGWLMQMADVRKAVVDLMKTSKFQVIQEAADSIEAEYSNRGPESGAAYVMRTIDHSDDDDANYMIASSILEAIYILTSDGTRPVMLVERMVQASAFLVNQAARDSATVFETAKAVGIMDDGARIRPDDPAGASNAEADMDVCPVYDVNGMRVRDTDANPPELIQFLSTVDLAFQRIVSKHVALQPPDGSNVVTKGEYNPSAASAAPTPKPWWLSRVVTPLWNHGNQTNYTSELVTCIVDYSQPGNPDSVDARETRLDNSLRLSRLDPVTVQSRDNRLGRGESANSMFVDFCMLRGLCGHKGPHQTLVGIDDPLEYDYPSTRMQRRYRRGMYALMPYTEVSREVEEHAFSVQGNAYAPVSSIELHTDFFGHVTQKLGTDSTTLPDGENIGHEDAKPVMWAPVNASSSSPNEISYDQTCKAVCEAATYEFMVKSLLFLAEDTADEDQKRLVLAAAASAKLRQVAVMAKIKSTNMTNTDFMSMPGMRKHQKFVTRPARVCVVPGQPFDATRMVFPVDAGIAMFRCDEALMPIPDLKVAPVSDPTALRTSGYYAAGVRTSDGNGIAVRHETLSSWLRMGIEGPAPNRKFQMSMEADAENQPVDTSSINGKIALTGDLALWLAPQDVRVDSINNLMASSLEAVSSLVRIKHEEAYISKLEQNGSAERQAIFGIERSIEDSSRDRRAAVWSDALREVAVSGDRLYRFVTTLTGAIGEAADSAISWEDDDLKALSKEAATRQKAISERVSRLQTKLVESVVSSTLRSSKLQLDLRNAGSGKSGDLVVISSDLKDSIREITDGEAGHGFFEASVELGNLMGSSRKPMPISEIVRNLQNVSSEYHDQIASGWSPTVPASYQRVVEPRNSFMLHLKPDTSAAIQKAFDYITSEMRHCPGYHRHIHLWEYVEGKDWILSTRFAELTGLMLQNTRMRSGNFAAYVGTSQLISNGHNIRMQIQRLKTQVCNYLMTQMNPPLFLNEAGRTMYFGGSVAASTSVDDRGYSEVDREVKRQKRMDDGAPFGGDDGDDRDERPGLPSNFPRPSMKEDLLERILENARVRRNNAKKAFGPSGPFAPSELFGAGRAYLADDAAFNPNVGGTTAQVAEVTYEYLLNNMPSNAADLAMKGRIVMQMATLGKIPVNCDEKFDPRAGLTLEHSICKDLMTQGYEFRNGALQKPNTRANGYTQMRLPRVGLTNVYMVRIDTTKHWPGLTRGDHHRSKVKQTMSVALNHVFGMELYSLGKPHDPDRQWMPHPAWSEIGVSGKYSNVWIKPVGKNDSRWTSLYSDTWFEISSMALRNKVSAMTIFGIVITLIMHKSGVIDANAIASGAYDKVSRHCADFVQSAKSMAAQAQGAFTDILKRIGLWPRTDPKAGARMSQSDKETLANTNGKLEADRAMLVPKLKQLEDLKKTGLISAEQDLELQALRAQDKSLEEQSVAARASLETGEAPTDERLIKSMQLTTILDPPKSIQYIVAETAQQHPELAQSARQMYENAGTLLDVAAKVQFTETIENSAFKFEPSVTFKMIQDSLSGSESASVLNGLLSEIPIEDLLSGDPAGMEKIYQEKLDNLGQGALVKGIYSAVTNLNPLAFFYSGITQDFLGDVGYGASESVRNRDTQLRQAIVYFQTKKAALAGIDPETAAPSEWLDVASWTWVRNAAVNEIGTTVLAFMKMQPQLREKVYSEALLPMYKALNLGKGTSFSDYIATPEMRETFMETLTKTYRMTRVELEEAGIVAKYTNIIESGRKSMFDELSALLADAYYQRIPAEYDATKDMAAFEVEARKNMLLGDDVDGVRVVNWEEVFINDISFISRKITNPENEKLANSFGKWFVDNDLKFGGKLTSLGLGWEAEPFVPDTEDPELLSAFQELGLTKGIVSGAVLTHLYRQLAATTELSDQKHMYMATVALDRINFFGAADKAKAEAIDTSTYAGICESFKFLSDEGLMFKICNALTSKLDSEGNAVYTEENGRITSADGKVRFHLPKDHPKDAPFQLEIPLDEIFSSLPVVYTEEYKNKLISTALSVLYDSRLDVPWKQDEDGKWAISTVTRSSWGRVTKGFQKVISLSSQLASSLSIPSADAFVVGSFLLFGAANMGSLSSGAKLRMNTEGSMVKGLEYNGGGVAVNDGSSSIFGAPPQTAVRLSTQAPQLRTFRGFVPAGYSRPIMAARPSPAAFASNYWSGINPDLVAIEEGNEGFSAMNVVHEMTAAGTTMYGVLDVPELRPSARPEPPEDGGTPGPEPEPMEPEIPNAEPDDDRRAAAFRDDTLFPDGDQSVITDGDDPRAEPLLGPDAPAYRPSDGPTRRPNPQEPEVVPERMRGTVPDTEPVPKPPEGPSPSGGGGSSSSSGEGPAQTPGNSSNSSSGEGGTPGLSDNGFTPAEPPNFLRDTRPGVTPVPRNGSTMPGANNSSTSQQPRENPRPIPGYEPLSAFFQRSLQSKGRPGA